MSKVDAQRSMREAKYARTQAGGTTRREAAAAAGGTPKAPVRKPAPTAPKPDGAAAAAPQGELCGHRSMNGRSCTREAGHAEKNHRYG